jgi:hypothetical protein
MGRLRFAAIALLSTALEAGSPAALAQAGFQPSPGLGNIRLDLDTEGGNASHFEIRKTCGLNAVRMTFSMPRLGEHQRWLPVATIGLANAEQGVSLQIGGSRTAPSPIGLRTITKDVDLRVDFKKTLAAGQKIDVTIDWTPGGEVRVAIGDEIKTANLSGGIDTLSFSNSTGEALIDPLSIGRTAAPVRECPMA